MVGAGVRKESGPLWVILTPGPGGNGSGQFLCRAASRPRGLCGSKGHAVARSVGDG